MAKVDLTPEQLIAKYKGLGETALGPCWCLITEDIFGNIDKLILLRENPYGQIAIQIQLTQLKVKSELISQFGIDPSNDIPIFQPRVVDGINFDTNEITCSAEIANKFLGGPAEYLYLKDTNNLITHIAIARNKNGPLHCTFIITPPILESNWLEINKNCTLATKLPN